MNLVKKNIHMNKTTCKTHLQIHLNDDMNVPDNKPDVDSIIKLTGEVTVDEQKILSGNLSLKGALCFQLLYISNENDRRIQTICGRLPIDETLHIPEGCSIENTILSWNIEDFTANLINSRKISLRSLLTLTIRSEEIYDEIACVDVTDSSSSLCKKSETIHLTNLAACKKDSYRFREDLLLPTGKGLISELLYHDLQIKNVDIRLLNDQFSVKGEFNVFLFYLPERDDAEIEYFETDIPFYTLMDCHGCSESMIPDITLSVTNPTFEVRPDADGESRSVHLDTLIEMQIKIYEETSIELITDIYSPSQALTPSYRPVTYENLILHNQNKARISEHCKLPPSTPKILQICHGFGSIHPDDITQVKEGLHIEGALEVTVFYITSEDSHPVYAANLMLPFEQTIEVLYPSQDYTYRITPELEQLTILSTDTDELEVKANLIFDCFLFEQVTKDFLSDVTEEPFDYDTLFSLPGMIGYVVKEGDTLWDIAKSHHTTINSIKELNDLSEPEPAVGTKLLLIKEISLE